MFLLLATAEPCGHMWPLLDVTYLGCTPTCPTDTTVAPFFHLTWPTTSASNSTSTSSWAYTAIPFTFAFYVCPLENKICATLHRLEVIIKQSSITPCVLSPQRERCSSCDSHYDMSRARSHHKYIINLRHKCQGCIGSLDFSDFPMLSCVNRWLRVGVIDKQDQVQIER